MSAVDPYDVQQVRSASGLLADFNRGGVLGAADVHVAGRLQRLGGEPHGPVLLAAALVVRAVRQGSVCLDVARAASTTSVDDVAPEDVAALPWPEPAAWLDALRGSPLVAVGSEGPADRPLRLVGGLLYLDRYWRQEQRIATYVDDAWRSTDTAEVSTRALARLFPGTGPDRQRLAAVVASHRRFAVLAGGPGTGKTTTVAKLLALLQDQAGGRLRIALAAPTGKAAARLQEAAIGATASLPQEDRERLGPLTASTLHRLLGYRPGSSTRFWHDRDNRLPHDVVVVDEASMVSLTMMARLVEALRPTCRLLLVGDPDQLASVEVGAVLGDLVQRPAPSGAGPTALPEAGDDLADLDEQEQRAALTRGVVRLSHVYRFSEEIQRLADAIRLGDVEALDHALAATSTVEFLDVDPAAPGPALTWGGPAVGRAGRAPVDAARAGHPEAALEALDRHRLLCAHREGPYGVERWSRQAEQWLGEAIDGYARDGLWYVGRPLLVTANDHQLRVFNGDTAVVVDVDGHPQAAVRRDGVVGLLATSRLSDVQTMHALSVHRSQGSQFERVTVVLPPADSPLLTRELLYTAVTRAQRHVRVVGTTEALHAAVRRPVVRASGLGPAPPG
jgi:exodeoxyribonuclease V alpha subunit